MTVESTPIAPDPIASVRGAAADGVTRTMSVALGVAAILLSIVGSTAFLTQWGVAHTAWTLATSGDRLQGFIFLVYRQFFSFVAVAFFSLWLRRTAQRISEFRAVQQRRVAAEHATAAAVDERRQQLDRVRQIAGPALADIATGRVDAAQRDEHRLLEAALRDLIRGRALARGALPAAAHGARGRGIDVAIIDDLREDNPGGALASAIAWAAERITGVVSGEVTVRLAREGDDRFVTFATADGVVERLSLEARETPRGETDPHA